MDIVELIDGYHADDIVIVGLALNTAAGNSPEQFWENISNKTECISSVRSTRKNDLLTFLRNDSDEEIELAEGGLFSRIDLFDNKFFHIREQDALCTSPCMRMLLEVMWKALEDAGYRERDLNGENVNIYTGIVTDAQIYEYREIVKKYCKKLLPTAINGNLLPVIPAALAYYLNLKGTTAVVDTACASSSTAVIQAADALKSGQCKAAVVAGGRMIYNPVNDPDEKIGIESGDFRARPFDETAEGTVHGEGVAAIVIKTYRQALLDRDRIYAVIKGYAANQSGKTPRMGISDHNAQKEVILKGMERAGFCTEDIQYCEAHGTGTYVGDQLEVRGIEEALAGSTGKRGICALGSVKGNIGHTYGASGVISVIKCIMAMKKGFLPPTANFDVPNRKIDFIDSPLYVNTKLTAWNAEQKRCMVNCYGISGVNCAFFLENYCKSDSQAELPTGKLPFAITAKSARSLKMLLGSYSAFLQDTDASFRDLSYSAMVRRNHFKHKLLFLAESKRELQQLMQDILCRLDGTDFESAVDHKTSFYSSQLNRKHVDHAEHAKAFMCSGDEHDLRTLCRMYLDGVDVDWNQIYGGNDSYVTLPSYEFDRHRIWATAEALNSFCEDHEEVSGVQKVVSADGTVSDREKELGEILLSCLSIGTVDVDDNLFSLGLDSFLGMKLLNSVKEKYGTELSIIDLFEADSIRKIAACTEHKADQTEFVLRKADQKAHYDLSPAQRRIYLQDKLLRGNRKTLLQGVYVINGKIDINRLERAVNQIIRNNEVLRTALIDVNGIPQQVVKNGWEFRIETGTLTRGIEAEMETFISQFNLANPPFIRIRVLEADGTKDVFMFCAHHTVFDGASILVFLDQLDTYYRGEVCAQSEYSYIDYSESMNRFCCSEQYAAQRKYWEQQYENREIYSNLPKSYDIAETSAETQGRKYYFSFSKELTGSISEFAVKHQITAFMELYLALVILLHQYSGDSDVCVGIPYAGRKNADAEKILGVFINTLAVSTHLDRRDKVSDLIERIKENCVNAFQNADYGYEELVQKVGDPFNVMFIFQNMGERVFRLGDLTGTEYDLKSSEAKYDMTVEMFPENGVIRGNVEYNTALVSEKYVAGMISHLENVLRGIMADTDRCIAEIPLLDAAHTQELLELGRGTVVPVTETVIDKWYRAAQNRDDEAIRFHDRSVTYAQLDAMSDTVASFIVKHVSSSSKMIPVLMHRSDKLIAVLLGILKAGCSYIPLDPKYPENRISYIVRHCCADTVITDTDCRCLNDAVRRIPIEDILCSEDAADRSHGKINRADLNDVSYTIYTSGTTGNPKGVSVRHRELSNFIHAMDTVSHFTRADHVLCVTTICFDIFVLECFCTLCSGACMILADETECADVNRLADLICKNDVSIIQFTPSRMQVILLSEDGQNAMKQLRTVFLGGEGLNTDVLNRLKLLTDARIINMYGPTETTVWSTYKDMTDSDIVTIGRPLENTNIYILNDEAGLQYQGGIGEIAIGGAGVSKGYVNNTALTAEKFIAFSLTGELVYKTGDLGRWNDNGELICLGRNDHQVKIRGYRVELGEIEEAIGHHEAVVKAAAATKSVGGNQVLLVFVKTQNDEPMQAELLMAYAAEHLPHYMIPYAFIQVTEFPYTPNKKLDRKALAAMDLPQDSLTAVHSLMLPQSDTEKAVYSVWKAILEKDGFGCNQDFFHVGGNSLLLILMLSELKKQYPADLSVADLYECRTVQAIAQFIDESAGRNSSDAEAGSDDPEQTAKLKTCMLSGAQLRLYLLEQMDPVRCKYNIPSAFIVDGLLDVERLEYAINTVIKRHEILRTSFEIIDDMPMQIISDSVRFVIERVGLITDIDTQIKAFVREFDLKTPPLIHALIGRIDETRMLFLFDMHHLITDGTSAQLFIREIEKIYNGEALEPVVHQYKEYAIRANRYTGSEAYQKQLSYWKDVFRNEYKKVKLPTASANHYSDGSTGRNYYFEIGSDLRSKMKAYGEQHNYTEYMLMIAALNILLHKYTGAEDLTVGTPVFGRNSREENEMLGVFINILVLRNYVRDEMSVKELFEGTKKRILDAFDHSGCGFEDLVQHVQVDRDLTQNPLFDIMFVYQIFGEKKICFGEAEFKKYRIKDIVPKYEMSFEMIPDENSIRCVLEYDAGLYSERYIQAFANHYLNILHEIFADDTCPVNNIRMESEANKQKLLALGKGDAYDVTDTVIDLWYRNLRQHPDDTAVVSGGRHYSFAELEHTSSLIANYLIEKFSDTDMVFCVLIRREYLLIAALLGILKAGGSYIPIDVSYPEDRILYILNSTEAAAYLSTSATGFKCSSPVHTLNIDEIVASYGNDNAVNACRLENVAYTIFTSGSTGNPKGVVIGQKAMSNFVRSIHRIEPFGTDTHMLGVTTVSFDIFVLECYVTLCYGGRLILADDAATADVGILSKLITDEHVNTIQFTPSRIMMLLEIPEYAECLKHIRTVFVGGEALTEDTLERLKGSTDARLINVYGPTETTVWSTFRDVTNDEKIAIGRPLDNTDVYILDKDNRLMFCNGIGELAIGGFGVANGYFNNPELTAERFIRTDFAEGRIYKTGDLAGWDDNGNLFCLGRIDNQVKIRGYRVELEEIDHVILSYNQMQPYSCITRSVTIAKEIDGVNELYTFVEPDAENSFSDGEALKKFAELKLPSYMVPKVITFVESIPFTGNGKVDRNALRNYKTEEQDASHEQTETGTETENAIHAIWSGVLGIAQIPYDSKFFEIGGNSLLLIRMLKKIREQFDSEITAGELFKLQTIRKIAERLDQSAETHPLYLKTIKLPDKLLGLSTQTGDSDFSLTLHDNRTEAEAYASCIQIFAGILSVLCGVSTIGLNISPAKGLFNAVELSADELSSTDNAHAITALFQSGNRELSAFTDSVQMGEVKLLFVMGQNVISEKLLHTFDIIVRMKYADDTLHIRTISSNKKINKSAVTYILNKTEVIYNKKFKL